MPRYFIKKETVLGAALLVTLVATLYGSTLRLWWLYDDFSCIHFLHDHTPVDHLFSSAAWRGQRMFTPFLMLSFQLDLGIFGLRTELFYLHQLLALAAAAIALYALLRLWLAAGPALLSAVLFVLGAPTSSWVRELLVRHYIEGLLCATLSTWSFVKSSRERRPVLAATSALLYLCAMLAKEVYVPLVVFLFLLQEERPGLRIRRLQLHMIALLVYLGWRFAILGTLIGGYGWTIRIDEIPSLILQLPVKFGASFLGESQLANGIMAVMLAIGVGTAVASSRRAALRILAAVVLVAVPVLSASKTFHPRYAGLMWLTIVIAFGFGCQAALSKGRLYRLVTGLVAMLAVGSAIIANRSAWRTGYAIAQRGSAEGRAFLDMKDAELLRQPSIPPAAMKELRWFKETYLGHAKGSGWFADDLYLCPADRLVRRMLEYDPAARSVVDVTSTLPTIRSTYCGALRDAPLSADLWREGGDLYWSLGPYAAGRYAFVIGDGLERFAVSRHDGYRRGAEAMTLRVRYESPDGWVTFSPELSVDLRNGRRFRWMRGAQAEH